MNIVTEQKSIEFTVKKSRFIGIIEPVNSEERINNRYHELKKEHPKANHVAYAFRLLKEGQLTSRFKDDGEVTGTAGKPIHNHIQGHDLVNTVIYVVRYFGGIKLGTGGLVKAYGEAAYNSIKASNLLTYTEYQNVSLIIDYPKLNYLEHNLSKFDAKIIEKTFSDRVQLQIDVPVSKVKDFYDYFRFSPNQ